VRLHKGILMEAIRLIGRSGHSSDPNLGNSALEGMHELIGEILHWRAELQSRHRHPALAVPVPTLNLGHIHGGDNANRICGRCELHIDLRPVPGVEPDELRAALAERVGRVAQRRGLEWEVAALFPGVPAMETSADSPIVRFAEGFTGRPAEAVAFATEGPFLTEMGMETLIWGPGDIAQAHQPNEYLSLDRIAPTLEGLRAMIQRFCVDRD
jgi:acetylornithine deacetylase